MPATQLPQDDQSFSDLPAIESRERADVWDWIETYTKAAVRARVPFASSNAIEMAQDAGSSLAATSIQARSIVGNFTFTLATESERSVLTSVYWSTVRVYAKAGWSTTEAVEAIRDGNTTFRQAKAVVDSRRAPAEEEVVDHVGILTKAHQTIIEHYHALDEGEWEIDDVDDIDFWYTANLARLALDEAVAAHLGDELERMVRT